MTEILYQLNPREKTQWDYSGSFTQSIRSYDIGASRELIAMKHYATIPSINIRVNYLDEMPVKQIKDLWKEHSKNLRSAGIVGRVAIEITKNERRTQPVNRVHYHLAVKDYLVKKNRITKKYTETPAIESIEMMWLVKEVFLQTMSEDSIHVTHKMITDWVNKDVWYFVKYRMRSNYLFRSGLWLQKFYTINEALWWTDKDGLQRQRKQIKELMQQYAKIKTATMEGQVNFMLGVLDDIGKDYPKVAYRHYVIDKINEWVDEKHDCLSSRIWEGQESPDIVGFPKELIGEVDFILDVLDSMGNQFNKEEYRYYIIENMSEWANKNKADLSLTQE